MIFRSSPRALRALMAGWMAATLTLPLLSQTALAQTSLSPVAGATAPLTAPTSATPLAAAPLALTALTPDVIAALAPEAIAAQTPSALGTLSAPQQQALTAGQRAALTPSQISALLPGVAGTAPTAATIAAPASAPAVLTGLEPQVIAALSPAAIAAAQPSQLAALSETQLRAVTVAQRQALTAAQTAALAPSQLAALPALPAAATAANAPTAATPSAAAPAAAGHGSEQITVETMFLEAHPIVKVVMVALALMSVWVWAVWADKSLRLASLKRRAARFEEAFRKSVSIEALYKEIGNNPDEPMAAVFHTGMDEYHASAAAGLADTDAMRDNLLQRVRFVVGTETQRQLTKLDGGMQVLATIGSTAVFIGLFGTVFGIMNSFIGIAAAKNTSLAVVAPGIAEALLATAIGLIAAIPAVIFYNIFAKAIGSYAQRIENFGNDFAARLSRELEHQAVLAGKA